MRSPEAEGSTGNGVGVARSLNPAGQVPQGIDLDALGDEVVSPDELEGLSEPAGPHGANGASNARAPEGGNGQIDRVELEREVLAYLADDRNATLWKHNLSATLFKALPGHFRLAKILLEPSDRLERTERGGEIERDPPSQEVLDAWHALPTGVNARRFMESSTLLQSLETGEEPAESPIPVRLKIEDVRHPPRESFLLAQAFPFSKASAFFGPTSVGKTALIAQVLFSFAAGAESVLGLPLFPGGGVVVVFTAEDNLDDWRRKAAAIAEGGGIDIERALSRLYVIDKSEGLARLSEVVTEHRAGLFEGESVTRHRAQPTEERAALIREARRLQARAVLIETASRLVDEEDNPSLSALQSALGAVAAETGAAVIVTHHATKAAARDNDSAIESARGGGAFIGNARNALSLFPAEPDEAAPYLDRFPEDDLVVLSQGKGTSSVRRMAPRVLVRSGTSWGAVFRCPDEVSRSPEEDHRFNARLSEQRDRERAQLGKLFDLVAELGRLGAVSERTLRDHLARLGARKKDLAALILSAERSGVVKLVPHPNARGKAILPATDPRAAREPVETATGDRRTGEASEPEDEA